MLVFPSIGCKKLSVVKTASELFRLAFFLAVILLQKNQKNTENSNNL
jgi:hypothetical protein